MFKFFKEKCSKQTQTDTNSTEKEVKPKVYTGRNLKNTKPVIKKLDKSSNGTKGHSVSSTEASSDSK